MNRILSFTFVIAVLLIASCTADKAEDAVPDPCAYDATQLKYNGLVKTIINTNCAADGACHGTPQETDAGGDMTTYALLKVKLQDGTFNSNVFETKDMPKGSSLSSCDFQKLKDWYDAGFPE